MTVDHNATAGKASSSRVHIKLKERLANSVWSVAKVPLEIHMQEVVEKSAVVYPDEGLPL